MKVEPIRDKELIRECMEYLKWKDEKYYIMFSIGIFTYCNLKLEMFIVKIEYQ